MQKITVTLNDESVLERPAGTMVKALLPEQNGQNGLPYLAAMINNDVSSLTYPLSVNSFVRFLTRADPHGWRIYRRSLSFLVAKAVHDVFPEALLTLEHSIGSGLYCTFRKDSQDGISATQVQMLGEHVRDLINKDYPIERPCERLKDRGSRISLHSCFIATRPTSSSTSATASLTWLTARWLRAQAR